MYTIIGGDGKEYGPVPTDQIRSWIGSGRANLDTQAKALGTGEWRRLGDFAEFDPAPADLPPRIGEDAPNAAAPDVVLAGRWIRLGARLLDGLLAGVLMGPGLVLMFPWIVAHRGENLFAAMMAGPPPYFSLAATGWFVVALTQVILLSTRGQTVGKIITGIRIVRIDGRAARFVHAWLLRSLVVGAIGTIPVVGFCFEIADILFIFSDQRRCLHDLIAGTRVVTVDPPTS